jgi:hypothetical protein
MASATAAISTPAAGRPRRSISTTAIANAAAAWSLGKPGSAACGMNEVISAWATNGRGRAMSEASSALRATASAAAAPASAPAHASRGRRARMPPISRARTSPTKSASEALA